MIRTEEWDKIMVQVGKLYVRDGRGFKHITKEWAPDLTQHIWDAKRFENWGEAWVIAKRVGGTVRKFDLLKGVFIK